jgi:4-azaleucine resistance transporter AzlC
MSNDKPLTFGQGVRAGLPFVLVIGPFGLLFGVVGSEAGLDLAQVMTMTFLVIAGAAQFAAVQQMVDNAPVIMVLVTSLAVNLRMAMYSASMVPHLGEAPLWKRALVAHFLVDQTAVLGIERFESRADAPLHEKLAFFFGVALVIAPFWYAATLAGAVVGSRIPESFALDFAVPITFLAMIAPMVKSLAHLAAAITSVVLALLLAWMPYGSGLLLAALAAMTVGSLVEVARTRGGTA